MAPSPRADVTRLETAMLTALLVALGLLQTPAAAAPAPEAPVEIAPGVHLIRSVVVPGRGPDGNTIVFEGPDGLVVVDTGRHTWQSDAILAFARARKRPIVAIVNTHWHLDHSSGNRRIKAEYPRARVYTTRAVDRAIGAGGFLTRDLDRVRGRIQAPDTPPVMKEEMQIFVATMDARETLRPDVPVEASTTMRLAGRPLDVRVTDGAVTDADVWIYDAAAKVAVLGDLATVPVPYFETACPDRWTAALDEVWATPFETAIPGHGRPLTRAQFDAYRGGLKQFVACARSERPAADCGADWVTATTPILGDDAERRKAVAEGIQYYVKYLRDGGGKAPDCRAR
jgi:glyoxylase-like metal-dependent hydrolase (beta-lactamase superfamily II)